MPRNWMIWARRLHFVMRTWLGTAESVSTPLGPPIDLAWGYYRPQMRLLSARLRGYRYAAGPKGAKAGRSILSSMLEILVHFTELIELLRLTLWRATINLFSIGLCYYVATFSRRDYPLAFTI